MPTVATISAVTETRRLGRGCDETHKVVTCFVTCISLSARGLERIPTYKCRFRPAFNCIRLLLLTGSHIHSQWPNNGTGLEMHDDHGSNTKLSQLTFGERGRRPLRHRSDHSASRPRGWTHSLLSHRDSRALLRGTPYGVSTVVRAEWTQGPWPRNANDASRRTEEGPSSQLFEAINHRA